MHGQPVIKVWVFRRKVLREISGPTKERYGTGRIKINDELDELIKNTNILNLIKAQTLPGLVIYIDYQKREW
jgi:hypothetical protein